MSNTDVIKYLEQSQPKIQNKSGSSFVDTIIVPTGKTGQGFEVVFIGQNSWYWVRISEEKRKTLKYAAGLHKDDIILDAPVPYLNLQPHSWRRLKTKGSARHIPLIGTSLWAAKRTQQHDSSYAFPRYCDGKICNANSASAALNKWMKKVIGDDFIVHGLRHSLRDRLRAVECPSDIIDAIGGWTTKGVGHAYGKGYAMDILAKWMRKIDS